MLQFQTDVSSAQLARVQGLSDLRQLLGYESIGADYDVAGSFDYQPVTGESWTIFRRRRLQNRPDLRAAQLGVTAANSQHALQKAIGKRDVTGQVSYTHLSDSNDISLFGQIQMPIFDRNQGEIARTGFAITQAQEQEKFASGQVLTDVRDAFENAPYQRPDRGSLSVGLSGSGAAIPRYQRIRLPARCRQPAGFSRCRAQLPGHATGLSAGARIVPARARTASRSRRNQEPAMKIDYIPQCTHSAARVGCCRNDAHGLQLERSRSGAGQMTSFSATASKSATPQLFTIPPDQMSHVQVVTIAATTMKRTLRLTGTVAYNAFNTTPVITQVGGPVSSILVVPGQHVKAGQPMLDVSSPDYSQLLDAYLKAADSFRLADKNYNARKDLYQHHAIAERDLEQAESDRNQAQADLNAAEQGMKILGIKNPADLAKAPSFGTDSRCSRRSAAKWSSASSRPDRWCRRVRRRHLRFRI